METEAPAAASLGTTRRLLPHEWVFGLFLASMAVRLGLEAGWLGSGVLFYGCLLLADLALIARCWREPTPARWRARLLFHPVAMNLVFPHLKTAIPQLTPHRWDAALNAIDASLLGRTPAIPLQAIQHPVLTEALSLCYLLFFPYLLVSLILHLAGELERAKSFCTGLFTLYGVGFLGYSLVPAAGPYLALADQFVVPLTGGRWTEWNAALVRLGSNGVDVFPSLHCAVSTYLLIFDRWHRRWRYRVYLVPCVGLWISTLYLRYHYAIDVVCGFLLAGAALALVRPGRTASRSPDAPVPDLNPGKDGHGTVCRKQ